MKTRLWLPLALLCSCGPLPVSSVQLADDGPARMPAVEPDAGAPLTGLPCDVRAVLEKNCASCHAGHIYGLWFFSREDFLSLANFEGQLVGEVAIERMSPGAQSPMPPYGAVVRPTPDEVATVSKWVAQGMPAGACGRLVAEP